MNKQLQAELGNKKLSILIIELADDAQDTWNFKSLVGEKIDDKFKKFVK